MQLLSTTNMKRWNYVGILQIQPPPSHSAIRPIPPHRALQTAPCSQHFLDPRATKISPMGDEADGAMVRWCDHTKNYRCAKDLTKCQPVRNQKYQMKGNKHGNHKQEFHVPFLDGT